MRRLEHHGQCLEVLPELGGAVARYTFGGCDVLRRCNAPNHPIDAAAFALIPFSGRIADAAFEFENCKIALKPNFPPEPHAIHGQCWLMPWQITDVRDDTLSMERHHTGEDWPWPYFAQQDFRLNPNGLCVTLSVMNSGSTPMPVGLGWHPYFIKAGARLSASTTMIWRNGSAKVGLRPESVPPDMDLTEGQYVNDLDLDHCYSLAVPQALLTWPEHGLRLLMKSSRSLSHLVVYSDQQNDFFCVEPVSHAPDAVHCDLASEITGLQVLKPGKRMTVTTNLLVELD